MIPRRPFNMPFISHFQIPILISHILKTLIDLSSAFCKSFNCFSPVLIKYSIRRILDLGIFAFFRNSVWRYSLNPGRPSEARISLLYRLKTDICSLLYLTGILLSIFAFCVNNTFFGLRWHVCGLLFSPFRLSQKIRHLCFCTFGYCR